MLGSFTRDDGTVLPFKVQGLWSIKDGKLSTTIKTNSLGNTDRVGKVHSDVIQSVSGTELVLKGSKSNKVSIYKRITNH